MTEEQRRELVERIAAMPREDRPTWHGRSVTVGGWRNSWATVTTSAPGFGATTWENVARVLAGEKTFDECALWKTSDAWLGCE